MVTSASSILPSRAWASARRVRRSVIHSLASGLGQAGQALADQRHAFSRAAELRPRPAEHRAGQIPERRKAVLFGRWLTLAWPQPRRAAVLAASNTASFQTIRANARSYGLLLSRAKAIARAMRSRAISARPKVHAHQLANRLQSRPRRELA